MKNVAMLVGALRQFPLLEPAQLAEVDAKIAPQFTDPKLLARELLARKWITPFQANLLFKGRGNELALGDYVYIDLLGEGGMGQVYKARHKKMGRIIALKVIRKERLANPDAIQRFLREIRSAAQLSHPNVVRAYDADCVGETYYFEMEYVEGADLARHVKNKGPLPLRYACDFMRQAALGLQHAHEKGLIHRDIKPANLLVTHKDKVLKILDMGLARPTEDEGSTQLTQEGSIMGTPDYIAPEQARDATKADIRSDIYSLGCSFYFLITGRVPFPGGTLTEKLLKHQMDTPKPIQELRKEVPPVVVDVIQCTMAKRPEDRFPTPGDLAAVLADILQGNTGAVMARSGVKMTGPLPPMPATPTPTPAPETVSADPFADLDRVDTESGSDTPIKISAPRPTGPGLVGKFGKAMTGLFKKLRTPKQE